MNTFESGDVDFDILVRSKGSGETPNIKNIDQFRSDQNDIEICRQWLNSNGVICYSTEFGLTCHAPQSLFETLFSTQVKCSKHVSGKPLWQPLSDPVPPPEISDYVDVVTVSAPPEFF